MTLIELARLVAGMRTAQRCYKINPKARLQFNAYELEKAVDEAVLNILDEAQEDTEEHDA